MRIIGVDPGTRHLGWGIVRTEGTRLVCEGYGVVHPSPTLALADRLVRIDDALCKVLTEYTPEESAVETLFFAKDAQAASKLGHARGVVLLVLAKSHVPICEYEPARVKRAVTGQGRAEKNQVAMMVKAILGLKELPAVDASDALAVAITHAYFARVDSVLAKGKVANSTVVNRTVANVVVANGAVANGAVAKRTAAKGAPPLFPQVHRKRTPPQRPPC